MKQDEPQTDVEIAGRRGLSEVLWRLLSVFFDFYQGATLVIATLGADTVGRHGRATLRTVLQLARLDVIV